MSDQTAIQHLFQVMVLGFRVLNGLAIFIHAHKEAAQIKPARFRAVWRLFLLQPIRLTDQLLNLAHTHFGHQLTHFLSNEEEIVDHMLWCAFESLAQYRILSGNAHRAGVEVAFAHHDAASSNQRRCGKAELICAQ